MNALGRQRLKQQVSSPKGGTTTATAAASRQLEGLCQECDDSSSYKSYIERDAEGLYPISYQCETSPQWVTSEITIQFDYEMIIADDDDDGSITSNNAKEENVRAMAWSFLEYVAKQTGISQRCNFDLQYEDSFIRPSGGTRRRQLQQSFLYYPTTIYSIRSLPEDRFGMTGDCLALQNTERTTSTGQSSSSSCIPVTAMMDIKYRGDPDDGIWVQEYIKALIQDQMQTDPSRLYVRNVTGLGYVGERISFDNSNIQIQAGAGWGIAAMTTVVSLSTLMVFGIAFILMKRKKATRVDLKTKNNRNDMADLEMCSTEESLPDPPGDSPTNSTLGSSTVTLLVSTEDMQPFPSSSSTTLQQQHHQQLQTVSSMDSNDHSIQSEEAPTEQEAPSDSSPPEHLLPPIQTNITRRKASKTLKKQRKKKKKRKKSNGGRENTMLISPTMLLPISETIVPEGDRKDIEEECSEIDTSSEEGSSLDEDINSSTPVSLSEDIYDKDFDFIIETTDFPSPAGTQSTKTTSVPTISALLEENDREDSIRSLISSGSDIIMDPTTPTSGCVSPIRSERNRQVSPSWTFG